MRRQDINHCFVGPPPQQNFGGTSSSNANMSRIEGGPPPVSTNAGLWMYVPVCLAGSTVCEPPPVNSNVGPDVPSMYGPNGNFGSTVRGPPPGSTDAGLWMYVPVCLTGSTVCGPPPGSTDAGLGMYVPNCNVGSTVRGPTPVNSNAGPGVRSMFGPNCNFGSTVRGPPLVNTNNAGPVMYVPNCNFGSTAGGPPPAIIPATRFILSSPVVNRTRTVPTSMLAPAGHRFGMSSRLSNNLNPSGIAPTLRTFLFSGIIQKGRGMPSFSSVRRTRKSRKSRRSIAGKNNLVISGTSRNYPEGVGAIVHDNANPIAEADEGNVLPLPNAVDPDNDLCLDLTTYRVPY